MKIIKLIEMSCSETSVEVDDDIYEELLKNPNMVYNLTREASESGDFHLYTKASIEVESEDCKTITTIDL